MRGVVEDSVFERGRVPGGRPVVVTDGECMVSLTYFVCLLMCAVFAHARLRIPTVPGFGLLLNQYVILPSHATEPNASGVSTSFERHWL